VVAHTDPTPHVLAAPRVAEGSPTTSIPGRYDAGPEEVVASSGVILGVSTQVRGNLKPKLVDVARLEPAMGCRYPGGPCAAMAGQEVAGNSRPARTLKQSAICCS